MNKTKEMLIKTNQKGYRVEQNVIYSPDGKILDGFVDNQGYVRFKPSKSTDVFVHRLVAYQKFGDIIFNDDFEIRHLDGDKLNNFDHNIDLGDHSRNMMDIPKDQRLKNANHAASFLKKYNNEKVREYYDETKSYKDTMKLFGITSKGTLHYILNGRNRNRNRRMAE